MSYRDLLVTDQDGNIVSNRNTHGHADPSRQRALEVLTEAALSCKHFIAGDGNPSIRIRDNREAAELALDALQTAGARITWPNG